MTDLREAAQPLQGGLSNDELLKAWQSKLPGVEPKDRDLTAFALGVEVGAALPLALKEEAGTESFHLTIPVPTKASKTPAPTRLWIDTEFNEFRGALISLALVDEDGRSFYEVLDCPNPGSWVAANVMPILGQNPISEKEFKLRLQDWLRPYGAIHIVADWPEDIEHFCHALITGPGFRLDTPPLTMEVRSDLEGLSQLPHNALSDAKANRFAHLELDAARQVSSLSADAWQSMDSAPKDRTFVLLLVPTTFGKPSPRLPLPGHWRDNRWFTVNHDGAVASAKPTHWQPLPVAPAQGERD